MKISQLKEQIRQIIRERSINAIQKEYGKVISDMEHHLELYKKSKGTPDEKKHILALKTLTVQKKKLQAEIDTKVAGLYRNAELKVDESVNEISYDSNGNLKIKKQYKTVSDYEKNVKNGDIIWVGKNPNDFKGIGKALLSKVLGKDSDGNVILTPFGKNKKYTIPQKDQLVIVVESVNEGKKAFKVNPGIGKAKYSISSHDGHKKHNDGSDFWDIKIFKNKVDLEKGIKDYKSKGFIEESIKHTKNI